MSVASRGAVELVVATASQPGAVAILQLRGEGVIELLQGLTGRNRWPPGRLVVCDLDGLDEGVAVALRTDWAQVMPHGGPRVVRKVVDRLLDLGAVVSPEVDAAGAFPEAADHVEAQMLSAMARAASPAAVDLLAAQPALWREAGDLDRAARQEVRQRSAVLDRLLVPPSVVVVGRPNVGKSTLTNAMLGRAASVVADLPGTTRDWVAGLAELAPAGAAERAVAVRWTDTPGLRDSDDAIEREAIVLAREVLDGADVLIAMRDPAIDWPATGSLPRQPDLWVVNKADGQGARGGDGASAERPLHIRALEDEGLDGLAGQVVAALGLEDLGAPLLWAFCDVLRERVKD